MVVGRAVLLADVVMRREFWLSRPCDTEDRLSGGGFR